MNDDQHVLQDGLATSVSRRRLLQLSAAAGLSAFLAACGTAGVKTPAPLSSAASATGTLGAAATTGAPATGGPAATGEATPGETAASETQAPGTPVTGSFKMATWIAYIDTADDNVTHPSLDRFAKETGVQVDYQEVVNANEEFYAAQLKGPETAGVDTGWDLVVLTDWMIIRLINLGWLESIAPGKNFPANLGDIYKTREWDKSNQWAAPWQSGMTGIGFDKNKTGELTSLDIFFDPKYAGRMTYQSEMRDTIGLTALQQGADPTNLTQEQFDAAIAAIKKAISDQLVRQLTGNDYIEGMASGDVKVAMAWSGDIATLLVPKQKKNQDFQWRLADQGGMLWTDNMAIPKGARNKAQAQVFIDWYYIPANAAEVEAFVNYVCPVKGADKEIVKLDASLATNTLIFPTADMSAKLHQFKALDLNTASQWEDAFTTAIGQ